MSFNHGNTQYDNVDVSAFSPSVVNQHPDQQSSTHVPPTSRELRRFLERRRAHELGYELPLNTREAAAYVGLHYKTVVRMARKGEIPAHRSARGRRYVWEFYPAELDTWLRMATESRCHYV